MSGGIPGSPFRIKSCLHLPLPQPFLPPISPPPPPQPSATPADVGLLMQLGVDGVFVGSGIFKSALPAKRARAMVKAVTYYNDPKILAEVSEDLGEAMVREREREREGGGGRGGRERERVVQETDVCERVLLLLWVKRDLAGFKSSAQKIALAHVFNSQCPVYEGS